MYDEGEKKQQKLLSEKKNSKRLWRYIDAFRKSTRRMNISLIEGRFQAEKGGIGGMTTCRRDRIKTTEWSTFGCGKSK